MEQTGRAFLRWTLAIIALAGLCVYAITNIDDAFRAGVAFGGDAGESAGAASGTGPVTSGEANPELDFALIANAAGFFTTDGMNVGPGQQDGLLLRFPLIPGDPECVASANLEMTVRSATLPTQFVVLPGGTGAVGELADGVALQEPIAIPLTAPPFVDVTAPGPVSWDLGQLYRTWATAGTYDGIGQAPEAGTPFTVVVRPNDQGAAGREVIFASSESPEARPRLIWTGAEACGTD